MSGASSVRDPGVAAEEAAEAVRVLNHLTLSPPSVGAPGWEDVADLYRVLTEVRVLVERLPQAIDQVSRHLCGPIGSGYRCDAGTDEPPDVLVESAVGALGRARSALDGVGRDLGGAQGALAHLAPQDATLAGDSTVGGGWWPGGRGGDRE